MELRGLLEHCVRSWDYGSERFRPSGRHLVINEPNERCEDDRSPTTLQKIGYMVERWA